jgi:hypothetical protein
VYVQGDQVDGHGDDRKVEPELFAAQRFTHTLPAEEQEEYGEVDAEQDHKTEITTFGGGLP